MNGDYAEYIETEVLPRVEKTCNVKLTKDPDGRAAMGNSSGGSAALIMAWFRTDLYHRVLTTSGTFVNQAWPFDPKIPNGAWDFHETLIPKSDKKPIRVFLAVGDRDLLNPNVMRDGMRLGKPATGWPRCWKGATIPLPVLSWSATASTPAAFLRTPSGWVEGFTKG